MSTRLQIGLLQCGYIAPDVAAGHGDYPEVFAELLGPHGVDLVTYDVQQGPVPTDPSAHDGWLVSGSASSAYEPLAWIAPVEGFLRQLISFYGDNLGALVPRYLETTMGAFARQQEQMRQAMRTTMEAAASAVQSNRPANRAAT